MRQPFPHQQAALSWARRRDAIALYMAMRLGKSLIAVRWANERLGPDDAALIIAPMSVIPAWLDELDEEQQPSAWLRGSSEEKRRTWYRAYADGVRWFLISPEGLRAAPDLATDLTWKVCILDEGHCISDPRTKFTKFMLDALGPSRVEHRCLLTGTPAAESLLQYYCQLKWLGHDLLGCPNYWKFRAGYFQEHGFKWYPFGSVKQDIINDVAKTAFVMRAEDSGMANQCVYERRDCEMAGPIARLYKQAEKEFACGDLMTRWAMVASGWLSQIAGGCVPLNFREQARGEYAAHKFALLESLLQEDFRRQPVVVFFRFNRELGVAYRRLRERGIKCRAFTGMTDPLVRRQVVKLFNRGEHDVLLVQSRAGRYGLNLSHATASIIYSNWWDWVTRDQLEARIRHPLRRTPALYLDLVTYGTVDEAVLTALRRKERESVSFLRAVVEAKQEMNPCQ